MKRKNFTIAFIAILATISQQSNATLKRLNNTPGIVADYSNLSDAFIAQSTWDTLYVEPSNFSYQINSSSGTSNITLGYINAPGKVILGNGYYLNSTIPNYTIPSLQENKGISSIVTSNVGLKIGNNTTCIGLYFQNPIYFNDLIYPVSGINLISCNISNLIFYNNFPNPSAPGYVYNYNNIKILKNYIRGSITANTSNILDSSSVFSNISVQNNIILGNIDLSPFSFVNNNLIFRNNIISSIFKVYQAYCANNIFLDVDSTNFNFTDNNLKNNIFVAPSFAINNAANVANNQFNINQNLLFNSLNIYGGLDADYYLASGSPAIGAGVPNGSTLVDCGAFGGPDPYKLSGIPPFPTIYELTVPAVIPAGSPMNISLSTRSNN